MNFAQKKLNLNLKRCEMNFFMTLKSFLGSRFLLKMMNGGGFHLGIFIHDITFLTHIDLKAQFVCKIRVIKLIGFVFFDCSSKYGMILVWLKISNYFYFRTPSFCLTFHLFALCRSAYPRQINQHKVAMVTLRGEID